MTDSIHPVNGYILFSVCPKMNPELSLRGAFWATKQSPPFYQGIASLKNRLRQKTPRNDLFWYLRTDTIESLSEIVGQIVNLSKSGSGYELHAGQIGNLLYKNVFSDRFYLEIKFVGVIT